MRKEGCMPQNHLGRNEPCHCGSGKKYKNCHYSEDRGKQTEVLNTTDNEQISPRHKQFLGLPALPPQFSGAGTAQGIKKAYALWLVISLFSLAALLIVLFIYRG